MTEQIQKDEHDAPGAKDRLGVLMDEYRVLYGLAQLRMGVLDRRVPLAGTAILAFLGAVPELDAASAMVVLAAIPVSLIWLFRTTVTHTRSLEDALRRIEAIERRVNELTNDELLSFQSSHPSRGRSVGGRTGFETVLSVLLASMLVLAGCVFLTINEWGSNAVSSHLLLAQHACVGVYLVWSGWRSQHYRYVPASNES